jgi:uncharacterized protein (TIGR02996 family)
MTVEEALLAADAAPDDAAALPHLLAAWRLVPAAELAAIVERVSERVAHDLPPVEGKTLKARHEAFLEVAARQNPADLPRLQAVIPTMRSAEAASELDALAAWPADPRHTPFFLAMIKKPPYHGSGTVKVWRRVFDLLVASGDPRLIDALPALDLGGVLGATPALDVSQRKLEAALGKLKKRFPMGPPRLDGRAREILGRFDARGKAQRASADELLARVLAAPEDDQARLVYADALQEAGDPRGELIVLQFAKLARPLTTTEARREKGLIHEHFARMLGDLAPLVEEDGTSFERGFPVRVRCKLPKDTHKKLALGHPLWATVSTVDIDNAESLPFEVLTHPVMRSLTGVINLRRGAWLELGARKEPLPWTHLGYWGPDLYVEGHAAEDLRAVAEDRHILFGLHCTLPRLRRLSLSGYAVGPDAFEHWLWDAPIVAKIERLDISSGVRALPAWVEEVRRRAPPALRAIGTPYHWDLHRWDAHVEGGADGPWSVLRAHAYPAGRYSAAADPDDHVRALEELPQDLLTEVHVTATTRLTKADVADIERAASRQTRLRVFRSHPS